MFNTGDEVLVISDEQGHLGKIVIIYENDTTECPYYAKISPERYTWFFEREVVKPTKITRLLYV